MLSEEQNRTLTEVGPGTPMGELLRRYWHPIAAEAELEETSTKAVRLLGEDLVLYKDTSGGYGLLQRWCAHRLTDLSFGVPEAYGLRCPLHGWLYAANGQCLEMPLEIEPFSERIKIPGYAVQAKAGLLWAYLGPEPAPLVPDWEPFGWQDGLVQVVFAGLACNWFQCQENAMDPADLQWLHGRMGHLKEGEALPPPPPMPGDLAIDFDEFDYGFIYRRSAGDQPWEVGRSAIWPNGLFAGTRRSCRFEWRVPLDDEHTLIVNWFYDQAAPGRDVALDKRVVHWWAPLRDEEDGEVISSHLLNQSFVIWLNQPAIVDRTREYLGEDDRGVVMLRDKFFSQIELVSDGGEPKAVFRDPEANRGLKLPRSGQEVVIEGAAPELAQTEVDAAAEPPAPEFPYLAGQPPEVAEAYRKVIESWREDAQSAGDA